MKRTAPHRCHTYDASDRKTFRSALCHLLQTEFPGVFGPAVTQLFAQRVEQLFEQFHPDRSGPLTVNTYNGEDLLSQTIQYVYWTDEKGEAHILLQIHGGCDVRGGYTDPVAFDLTDYDGTGIFDNARATIYCDDCGKHWDTDKYRKPIAISFYWSVRERHHAASTSGNP